MYLQLKKQSRFLTNLNFGLQGAVFTQDYPRAFAIAEQLKLVQFTSIIKHNVVQDNFPFLGVKGSGAGTQGVEILYRSYDSCEINQYLISQTTKSLAIQSLKKCKESPL